MATVSQPRSDADVNLSAGAAASANGAAAHLGNGKAAASTNGSHVPAPAPVPASVGSDPDVLLPQGSWYLVAKDGLDRVFAFLMLLMTSPLILIAMVMVKATSRGPAMYSQTRVGRYGKLFTIYKLRSMIVESESLTGACWSTPGDKRVTRVGHWLRRTHLDELPQLWNVMMGQMSLIGPRPERPEFVPMLEQAIPYYRDRLLVRPGITGFAQVQLPPDTDIASVRIKLAYDLHYVQAVSFWFDLRIYWATALKMAGASFDLLRRLFRFPNRSTIECRYEHLAQEAQRKKQALKDAAGRVDGVNPIPLLP